MARALHYRIPMRCTSRRATRERPMPKIEAVYAYTPLQDIVVMSAGARSGGKGVYARVAVMRVMRGTAPKMISERSRGVLRVVRTWEHRQAGSRGPNSAMALALAEACSYARQMIAGAGVPRFEPADDAGRS